MKESWFKVGVQFAVIAQLYFGAFRLWEWADSESFFEPWWSSLFCQGLAIAALLLPIAYLVYENESYQQAKENLRLKQQLHEAYDELRDTNP